MIRQLLHYRPLLVAAILSALLLSCNAAFGCPTCKDQLAHHNPDGLQLARGYAYSIIFMLSMPPLIFSSLCLYFWWEVRKARAKKAAAGLNLSSGPALSH